MYSRLRSARPSNALAPLRRFYVDGLGLAVLAAWDDHEGFDGLVLGPPGTDAPPWQVEFIVERGHAAPQVPSDEHLLVFYVDDEAALHTAVQRMASIGATPVAPNNPYWSRCGALFQDPDGYGVVIALKPPLQLAQPIPVPPSRSDLR